MKRFMSLLLACMMVCMLAPTAYAASADWEVSDEGIEFIKQYEGFSSVPYLDNGTWRIGYGTAIDPEDYEDEISERMATRLFRRDLEETAEKVNDYLGRYDIEVEQYQFDALASFTYNLGSGWMNASYKFSSYMIDGLEYYDEIDILDAFVVWCHVGKAVDHGLAERRLAEAMLLLYGDYEGEDSPEYTYVVLNGNGGTVESDIVCFEVGESLERLPTAQREDYVLAGWYTEAGKAVHEDDVIEEPMELTAKWFMDVDLPFTDVPVGAWYYGYVAELYSSGVVNGMTAKTFEPSGKVNYGQALKLILLATGLEPSDEEIEGHWALRYEDLAIEAGVVPEDFMGLNDTISRGDIARIAAEAMGLEDSSGKSPFQDSDDDYVMALYNAGIIEGSVDKNGKTYFYPDSDITRAEITTIIWRILNHKEKQNSNTIQYASYTLEVLEDVATYTRDDGNYYDKNGYRYYFGEDTWVGIDVSIHQGDIDWEKVAEDGVDYAIIRVGGRGYGREGNMYDDVNFEKNIEGALEAGLDVGVYYFSQAITVAEAREEAEYVLEHIEGYDITYPVVFDWERIGGSEARTYGLETDILCKIANTFCGMIEEAGYKPMVYFNSYCGYVKYNLSKISDYAFWFARYNDYPGFYYDFDMWQYSDTGSVSGIKGNVDLNISFRNFADE